MDKALVAIAVILLLSTPGPLEAEIEVSHLDDDFEGTAATLIDQATQEDAESDGDDNGDSNLDADAHRLPPTQPTTSVPRARARARLSTRTQIPLANLFDYLHAGNKDDTLAFYWKGGLDNLHRCEQAAEAAYGNTGSDSVPHDA
ncbi:hypothetical protein HWV62_9673 [Athelia sp. TMB]|nr:hypothetical protein HWV62_9673 [Athelia sp. TMB]